MPAEQSLFSGFKAGVMASVVSGGLYLLAMKHSPFFRSTFSASARTALTVGPYAKATHHVIVHLITLVLNALCYMLQSCI